MASLGRSLASLRLFGDDLNPETISRALGCQPTEAWLKGDVKKSKSRELVRKTGAWFLKARETEPADFEGQVAEILGRLTSDLKVWESLKSKYEIDLFCGWFMAKSNEGVSVPPDTMRKLSERGIELSLDIYGPDRDEST